MDEWFRWIASAVMTLTLVAIGWVNRTLGELKKQLDSQKEKILVLENRPHIDAIAHTRAMAELTAAVAHLALDLSKELQRASEERMEMKRKYEALEDKLDELTRELLVPS